MRDKFFCKSNIALVASENINEQLRHSDIEHILSYARPGSLVVLDIDDTIGRVPQTIGLDPWFRTRIQQFALEGHSQSQAVLLTIDIYNQAQLASTKMVGVDQNKNIADIIMRLKENGVFVMGLTARNHHLSEKTLSLLHTMKVSFSSNVLKNGTFTLNNKLVEIRDGVIFANGNDKGICFEQTLELGYFLMEISSFDSVDFVDDSKNNCQLVHAAFIRLKIAVSRVWHYDYAEQHLVFTKSDQDRAKIQEQYLLQHKNLLTDKEADNFMINHPAPY